jgi:hypothetical protein
MILISGNGISKPLLRGNHEGLDRMIELANQQEISAVRYDALQSISIQVQETIFLYWGTLASKGIVKAQKESQQRLNEIVENVKFLIKRGQLAAADTISQK